MKFDGLRSSTSVELGEDGNDGKPEESEVFEDDTVVGDMDGVQLRTVSFLNHPFMWHCFWYFDVKGDLQIFLLLEWEELDQMETLLEERESLISAISSSITMCCSAPGTTWFK